MPSWIDTREKRIDTTDRARRRFSRSECFRSHSLDEPCASERDVPLDGRSNAEDPTSLPLGQRPSDTLLGDVPAPSESEDLRPEMPGVGGRATSNWTTAVSSPTDVPDPLEKGNSPPSRSDSSKRPGDSAMEDTPPARRERTASQMEDDLAQDDAGYRDRFCVVLYDNATASGPARCASTPGDIENAALYPTMG